MKTQKFNVKVHLSDHMGAIKSPTEPRISQTSMEGLVEENHEGAKEAVSRMCSSVKRAHAARVVICTAGCLQFVFSCLMH